MNRGLYRCRHDRKIAGVASGVAEYFDADPSLVRILWIISIFFGGVGLFLYIAMALIVPLEPEEIVAAAAPLGTATGEATGQVVDSTGQPTVPSSIGWRSAPAMHRHASRGAGRGWSIVGVVLILFGSVALIDTFLPAWADGGRFLWPAFILGIGAILVLTSMRREPTDS